MAVVTTETIFNDEFPSYSSDLRYLLQTILTCFCIIAKSRKIVFRQGFRKSLFTTDSETDSDTLRFDAFFDAYAYLYALSLVSFSEPALNEGVRSTLGNMVADNPEVFDGLRRPDAQRLSDSLHTVLNDGAFWSYLSNIDADGLHRAGLNSPRLDVKLQSLQSKVQEFDENGSAYLLADVMDSADILLDSLIDAIPGIGSFLGELLKVLKKEIRDAWKVWRRSKH